MGNKVLQFRKLDSGSYYAKKENRLKVNNIIYLSKYVDKQMELPFPEITDDYVYVFHAVINAGIENREAG